MEYKIFNRYWLLMSHKTVICEYLMVSDKLFASDGTWTICVYLMGVFDGTQTLDMAGFVTVFLK